MIRELTKATEHMHDFHLVFQPQYKLDIHAITGVEALIRWNHPKRGWISPDQFIPVAESSGLIGRIGTWVIRQATRQFAVWRQAGITLRISVNVSPEQLKDEGFTASVEAVLQESGMDTAYLTLELTEGAALYQSPGAVDRLLRLRELGCSLAIDDFGTGYSSLKYLLDIPVQYVKLDRFFIQNLCRNSRAEAIIRSMIRLGKQLEFQVIAEGVESEETVEMLKVVGCHEIQGYWFSPPVEAREIPKMIAKLSVSQSS
ncbi:putative bifunctional diguanylate cyclase/phosphodiesterase [Paenibacillus sp. GCM10012307]|uniref:EAL domain-containing protein n=1 Tax=Paenibacillus roseus TaxID=2798579 RepID=A0A934J8L6_9BACL|nr:EAL domain-containing protein [Paenibacillus roseus]